MLGALGKREMEEGGTCALPAADLPAVRRQTAKVIAQSALLAAAATLLIWFL